jgi:hypothetical protein
MVERRQDDWIVYAADKNTFDPDIAARLTAEQVWVAVLSHRFTFAKTMPTIPHSYIVRRNWASPIPWENIVQFIRDHGVGGWFHRKRQMYWRWEGERYWTMGNPLNVTTIINQAKDVPVPYLRFEDSFD